MNYLILIIVGIIGIVIGRHFGKCRRSLISEQSKRKDENKEKVLKLFQENEKVANDDVEKLLEVSNSTAERYLDELEKEGRILQHGKVGQSVFYTLK